MNGDVARAGKNVSCFVYNQHLFSDFKRVFSSLQQLKDGWMGGLGGASTSDSPSDVPRLNLELLLVFPPPTVDSQDPVFLMRGRLIRSLLAIRYAETHLTCKQLWPSSAASGSGTFSQHKNRICDI